MMDVELKNAFVLDIEASGFSDDSYPIEIAWTGINHQTSDSFLISPEHGWTHWDEFAEMVHGISSRTLIKTGIQVNEAVKRIESSLSNALVYSDAVHWDQFWLNRLYNAADQKQSWKLLSVDLIDASLINEQLYSQGHHRALSDAVELATTIERYMRKHSI